MVNEQVIERLRRGDWSIRCNTEQRVNWVLQACDDAKIKWALGQKATECFLSEPYPRIICFYKDYNGIIGDIDKTHEKYGVQDITDWFFNSILTPLPICSFNINTDNIDWEYSLTCRPEGI